MITQSIKYRIHVEGQPHGEEEECEHTYAYKGEFPPSIDEAKKIAEDFETIKHLKVKEVTTVIKTRVINVLG